MGRERFVPNPFKSLELTEADKASLTQFAYDFFDTSVAKYMAFIADGGPKVDLDAWKLLKTKDDTRVYVERYPKTHATVTGTTVTDFPGLLMTGITWGTVDDCMFGALNPSLEAMRIRASYVEDMSGGALLATLEKPTQDEPFRSFTIKWSETDLPMRSAFVKNRDYVYVEFMNTVVLPNGERIGCVINHSVNFPQTHELPNRVRANMTICTIFRQVGPDTVEIYGSGVVDPCGDIVRALVVPTMATGYLAGLKFAHCSKMKKIMWTLDKQFAAQKGKKLPPRANICVTCTAPVSSIRLGDFGKGEGRTCKLCGGFLCGSCRIRRKLSFVGSDLRLEQRKVAFCGLCLQNARTMSPLATAREQIKSNAGLRVSLSTIDSIDITECDSVSS